MFPITPRKYEDDPYAADNPTIQHLIVGSVGGKITSNFFVGDLKIISKEDGVVHGGKAYFGSYPNEEHRSELKSPFERHNKEEDKPTPIGCELENLEEEIMRMDEHILEIYVPLGHNECRIHMSAQLKPTIIIENHEFPSIIGGKA